MKTYEGMFLTPVQDAAEGSWGDLSGYLTQTIENRGCQVKSIEKWDDRALCYPIGKEKRAAYVLVHFDGPADALAPLRRDFALSERVLRVMISVDEDEGRPDPLSLLSTYKPQDGEDEKHSPDAVSGESQPDASAGESRPQTDGGEPQSDANAGESEKGDDYSDGTAGL